MINEMKKIIDSNKTLSEDELYTLYLYSMIEKSEEDFRNGNYITLEELDKEMEEKYANYSITYGKEKHK